jgi:tricorn protease
MPLKVGIIATFKGVLSDWSPDLVDGASFGVPDTAFVSKEGEIVVEGIGVYPDNGFEVYDRPEEIAKGKDPSIEVAVK